MIRYAAVSFIRRRRRSVSVILGIALAVAFVVATLSVVDSSGRAILDSVLSEVEGDFWTQIATRRPDPLAEDLLAVSGVTSVTVYGDFQPDEVGAVETSERGGANGLAVHPQQLPARLAQWELMGNITLNRGETVVSSQLARDLRVELDDALYVKMEDVGCGAVECLTNLTIRGILIPPTAVEPALALVFLIHFDDLEWILQELGVSGAASISTEIWIDRTSLLDPYDLELSRRNLVRLHRNLEEATLPYGGSLVNDNISGLLPAFEAAINFQRVIFLFIALPVIILGLYVGKVSVDANRQERRREIAVLQVRGSSKRQVLATLILESLFGGVLAGVLGVLGGIGLASLLFISATTSAESGFSFNVGGFSAGTVLTAIGLGVSLAIVAGYGSVRRTAKIPLPESLQYSTLTEQQPKYSPTADLILIALGTVSFAIIALGSFTPGFFGFLFGGTAFFLVPLAPALLVVGLTRLFTMSSARLYAGFSRVLKPLTGDLYYIVRRNLRRNQRRTSNMAAIIALGVSIGVFATTLLASQIGWEDRQLRSSVGADVSLVPPLGDPTFDEAAVGVDGVLGASRVVKLPAQSPYSDPDIFAVQPSTLFQTAQPEPWYFDGLNEAAAKALLETEGSVLVSQQYFEEAFLERNDVLRLSSCCSYDLASQTWREVYVNVSVAGVVRALPGTILNQQELPSAIYGSFKTFESFLAVLPPGISLATTLLLDLEPSADLDFIRGSLLNLGATNIRVFEEERGRRLSDPLNQAITSFIRAQIAFTAVILTAGIGILSYAGLTERGWEFAGMVARGASVRQSATVLVGEALSIVLIGVTFGLLIGLGTGFIASQTLLSAPGLVEPLVPIPFILPPENVVFVALAIIAMLLASLGISLRMARMDIASALRNR